MANEQNLRPIRKGQLSKEELKRRQSNGGKKSAQVRRELKMLRQVAEEKLTEIMSNGKSLQENLVQKLIVGALASGAKVKETLDVFVALRDTSGQKPVDKVAQTDGEGNDVPVNDLSKIPTETLLKMAQAAGVGINAADGDVTDRRPDKRTRKA